MENEARVRLVVSDVDGTVLNPCGDLSPVDYVAAGRLRQAGIKLSLASARPSFGMGRILHMLDVQCACAGLNGAILFYPRGDVFAELPLDPSLVKDVQRALQKRNVDLWVYTRERWLVPRINGPNVRHNTDSLRTEPGRYLNIGEITDPILKLVGTSNDLRELASCGFGLQRAFAGRLSVSSSQPHYLDVTHPHADKGLAAVAIAERETVRLDAVMTIGDSTSDIPMFRVAGRSVAMGQATDEVKGAARRVTKSNAKNGFAWAVEYALGGKQFTAETSVAAKKG
jgi:Cof subfamily protein (haloacid dehalogenase superfamily)